MFTHSIGSSPGRILLLVLGINFLAETLIMLAFATVLGPVRYPWFEAAIDATILTLVLTPCLLWWVVRPLTRLSAARAHLLAHLFELSEAERARLGRELHDEIGQSFTSLLIQLKTIIDAGDLQEARATALRLSELGHHMHDEIRGIARGLHPRLLDDLGLAVALGRLCADTEKVHRIPVEFESSGLEERLLPAVELAAYRIAQESLTNAIRHAHPSSIKVQCVRERNQLVLRVIDDGRGFETAAAGMSSEPGLGLHGMQERALAVHGKLKVTSARGRGTTVELVVPTAVGHD